MTAHIPHLHAESMMLYAEDAAKTAKPWELWEFISFGMEDWQTLDSNPNWGFATDYRRKIKMADPQADAQAAAFEAVRKKLCKLQRYSFRLDENCGVRRVDDRCGNWIEFDAAHELFDTVAIDAAIAAAKENT